MIASQHKNWPRLRKNLLQSLPSYTEDDLLAGNLYKMECESGDYLRFDDRLVHCMTEAEYVAQRDDSKKYHRCDECFFGQLHFTQSYSQCFGPRCDFMDSQKDPLIYIEER